VTVEGAQQPDIDALSWSVVQWHDDDTVTVEVDDSYLQPARDIAARIAVQDKLDTLPDHTIDEVAPLFPQWRQPQGAHDAYPEDAIVSHDGTLWRSTTPNNVWRPGESGWHRYGASPDDGPQPWVQPTGAHDAYPAGAQVTHNGRTWENTHGDGNVWMPGEYGWTDIGPA
jgi:hypothetical protein